MHKVIYETGILVINEKIMDKPVIPPGASPVHSKKQLTAIAVNKEEIVIKE